MGTLLRTGVFWGRSNVSVADFGFTGGVGFRALIGYFWGFYCLGFLGSGAVWDVRFWMRFRALVDFLRVFVTYGFVGWWTLM